MSKHPFLVFLAIVGAFFILLVTVITVGIFLFFGQKPSIMKADSIGILKIEGIIVESDPILKTIRKFKEDNSIKAIIVRIDSPGGVVGPSQEIYSELKKLKSVKKVVASMGALGASGAYYIACAADKIIANPGTLTGSIGVIMEFANLQKLYQWAKLDHTVIKSGKMKDVGSPFRPMNPEEKEFLNQLGFNVHHQFKDVVVSERKIKSSDVEKVTDGRIFTGEQAKALGLIDQLGNFEDAIEVAKELGHIKGKPELLYPPKERMPLLRYLVDESLNKFIDQVTTKNSITSPLLFLMQP